jgi:uncharacterized membrane protein
MLTAIWGAYGFQVVDLMTSQSSFNSQPFVSKVITSMIAQNFPHGEFHVLLGCAFSQTTAASTFRKQPNNLSLKIIYCMRRTHLRVPILHSQTYGFLAMSGLPS